MPCTNTFLARLTCLPSDSGTGSLRDAVSKDNRIVVFDVGGVIKIEDRIAVGKNIYIAGQTAPGQGITVYGNGMSWSNANEGIVRYIRVRMGRGGDSGKDAAGIAEGKNIIFDHVSVSWGRDETFSINGDAQNITIQNSIIAQGLETHSCGGLMQTDGGISLFRSQYNSLPLVDHPLSCFGMLQKRIILGSVAGN